MCLAVSDSYLVGLERRPNISTSQEVLARRPCGSRTGTTTPVAKLGVQRFISIPSSSRSGSRPGRENRSPAEPASFVLSSRNLGKAPAPDRYAARTGVWPPRILRLAEVSAPGAVRARSCLGRLSERGERPRRSTPRNTGTTIAEESEGKDRDDARTGTRGAGKARRPPPRRNAPSRSRRSSPPKTRRTRYDLACASGPPGPARPGRARPAIGRRRRTQQGRGSMASTTSTS